MKLLIKIKEIKIKLLLSSIKEIKRSHEFQPAQSLLSLLLT